MLTNDFIFVIGAPRSGTTWLQLLLSSQKGVYTHLENTVFTNYLAPLEEKWAYERNSKFNKGLPKILNEQFWNHWKKELLEATYHEFLKEKRTDSDRVIILDKNPGNIFNIDLIWKEIPQAKIIHILRDGRDVIASSMNAKKNVGFGHENVNESAKQWVNRVKLAGSKTGCENFLEIRYEELHSDPLTTLTKIYQFLNWEINLTEIQKSIEENDFEKNKTEGKTGSKLVKANAGFYHKGKMGSWESELNIDQKYLIHVIAGDLLLKLGYIKDDKWWGTGFPRLFTKFKFRIKKMFHVK